MKEKWRKGKSFKKLLNSCEQLFIKWNKFSIQVLISLKFHIKYCGKSRLSKITSKNSKNHDYPSKYCELFFKLFNLLRKLVQLTSDINCNLLQKLNSAIFIHAEKSTVEYENFTTDNDDLQNLSRIQFLQPHYVNMSLIQSTSTNEYFMNRFFLLLVIRFKSKTIFRLFFQLKISHSGEKKFNLIQCRTWKVDCIWNSCSSRFSVFRFACKNKESYFELSRFNAHKRQENLICCSYQP